MANPLCMPIRIDFALHATVELLAMMMIREEDVKVTRPVAAAQRHVSAAAAAAGAFLGRRSCDVCAVSVRSRLCCRGLVELSGESSGESNRAMVLRLGGVEAHAFGAACVHPVDSSGQATLLPATAFATPPWWRPAPRMHNVGRAFADALDSDDARVSAHAQSWKPPQPQRIPWHRRCRFSCSSQAVAAAVATSPSSRYPSSTQDRRGPSCYD